MRVLFSSTSGAGHVFPMLPLARAALAAGHQVLWALGADARSLLAGTGIRSTAAGLSGLPLQTAQRELLAEAELRPPADRAAFVFPRLFGELLTGPMLADLLPAAEEWRPDLFVHEHAELAAPLAGAVLGVPSVTHSFGGAIPKELLADAGSRVASIWAEHTAELPAFAGCFASGYLDICPPAVQTMPTDHIGRVLPLRPVADTGTPASDVPVPAASDDPLVYVTLGTVRTRSTVLATVVEAVSALPVRVLVAVGPEGDPAALEPSSPNVQVGRWVDQPRVLERCALVASHAGSGTFLGALACGVPQLCLPQAADQFRNAAGGVRSGAALALSPDESTPETIAGAVTRLLDDTVFRDRAAVVAEEIRAMPSPAGVVDDLDRATSRG